MTRGSQPARRAWAARTSRAIGGMRWPNVWWMPVPPHLGMIRWTSGLSRTGCRLRRFAPATRATSLCARDAGDVALRPLRGRRRFALALRSERDLELVETADDVVVAVGR